MLHAMIMAGGGGTRFWPRSRKQRPKQFLKLAGDSTLLQQAYERLESQIPPERTWVLTAKDYCREVAVQLPALPVDRVVGEPCGRDTAPCICLAALLIARQDPDAVMVVTPADHVIEPVQEFRRALHAAAQLAEEHPNALITLGISPTFPATGYGYIHRQAEFAVKQGIVAHRVARFREKPNPNDAERFFQSGEFFWNSGIFIWKARAILNVLRAHQAEMVRTIQAIVDAWGTPAFESEFARLYPTATKISIDYAVMEHAPEVLVVKAPFRWDDVGSWLALERMHPQDAQGNTVLAQHVGIDTHGCIVAADEGHLVATVGVKDLLIVQDGNATLVADRRDEGAIRKIVEMLQSKGLQKYL